MNEKKVYAISVSIGAAVVVALASVGCSEAGDPTESTVKELLPAAG